MSKIIRSLRIIASNPKLLDIYTKDFVTGNMFNQLYLLSKGKLSENVQHDYKRLDTNFKYSSMLYKGCPLSLMILDKNLLKYISRN